MTVRNRFRSNDNRALLSAAIDGFGVVLGPEDGLTPAIAAGQLVRLLPDYAAPSRPMHLVFAADRRQTPKLRSFIAAAQLAFPAIV